ncbi:hypothetical protein E2562_027752, partial [Oryza meyeriana var. granulata]
MQFRDDDDGCCGHRGGAEHEAADVEDVVILKVSLLGDCQIGKTSFMADAASSGHISGQKYNAPQPGADQFQMTSFPGTMESVSNMSYKPDRSDQEHQLYSCSQLRSENGSSEFSPGQF